MPAELTGHAISRASQRFSLSPAALQTFADDALVVGTPIHSVLNKNVRNHLVNMAQKRTQLGKRGGTILVVKHIAYIFDDQTLVTVYPSNPWLHKQYMENKNAGKH